jgi:hypothetical protein
MPFQLKASAAPLAVAAMLFGVFLPATARAQTSAAHAAPLEARFRGCDAAGWCRFWIEPLDPSARTLHRVRPNGVTRSQLDPTAAVAVRDRLNALLADMIHQHKRIVLHGLRELDDGTFAATVTVNGVDVVSDPVLQELRGTPAATAR